MPLTEWERLQACFDRLDARGRRALLAHAESLAAGEDITLQRVAIERPQAETVVMAIRRLTRSYPMLDRRTLISGTAQCLSRHTVEGQPASAVIDELETLYAAHSERFQLNVKQKAGIS